MSSAWDAVLGKNLDACPVTGNSATKRAVVDPPLGRVEIFNRYLSCGLRDIVGERRADR